MRELGGSARPGEVVEVVARLIGASKNQRRETLASGALRFDNQVAFARQYLVWGGYLDSSKRGVWTLTEKGRQTPGLSHEEALSIYKKQHALHSSTITEHEPAQQNDESDEVDVTEHYREHLLQIIQKLPPKGFERLCQRLLRESEFEQVEVTGRSGDGGIDGIGVVKVNAFVHFRVLFQCKRYTGSVSTTQVRDFRGAMQGRTDKGIIITTGTFTKDAKAEAVRDGVPPIELVDGKLLVDMFETLELGLRSRKTFEVDAEFFAAYQVDG